MRPCTRRDFSSSNCFKHKERIGRASRLPEAEIIDSLYALVSRIEFHNESLIPAGDWMEAYRLCFGGNDQVWEVVRGAKTSSLKSPALAAEVI